MTIEEAAVQLGLIAGFENGSGQIVESANDHVRTSPAQRIKMNAKGGEQIW
jgi:hypothetical protein